MTKAIELCMELEHQQVLDLIERNGTVAEAIELHDYWATQYALFS